jgi:Bromodomain
MRAVLLVLCPATQYIALYCHSVQHALNSVVCVSHLSVFLHCTQPMCLEQMLVNVSNGVYETKSAYVADLQLIHDNAVEYNPTNDQKGRTVVHTAKAIMDAVESHAHVFKKDINYDVFAWRVA